MLELRVMRKIFVSMWEKVTRGWRKLREKFAWSVLLTRYYSGNQIQKNKVSLACGMYGGQRRCLLDFGGGIWGKELSGKPCVEEILWLMWILQRVGRLGLDWSGSELCRWRVVHKVRKPRVTWHAGFWLAEEYICFSRRTLLHGDTCFGWLVGRLVSYVALFFSLIFHAVNRMNK